MTDPPLTAPREDLYVSDRFEGLREAGSGAFRSIIVPVNETLAAIDGRFVDMRAARRGSLMIVRGETGAGKSTFLDTVGLFRTRARYRPIVVASPISQPAKWPDRSVAVVSRSA